VLPWLRDAWRSSEIHRKALCYTNRMTTHKEIHALSDDELLRRLSDLLSRSRRFESELVAHIAEVDDRRLYLPHASSMFTYATEVLHLSEHEAYLRITAARASRRFPILLEMLGDGRLHLSGIGKLAPHLTEENCATLLGRATHRPKRQIEELVVEIAPKPDVPPVMRKLPARPPSMAPSSAAQDSQLGPDRVDTPERAPAPSPAQAPAIPPAPPTPAPPPPIVEPLAPSRYKVQFTATSELREKLERLQALMDADLVEVVEAAVTEKLERMEAKRYAMTKAPRKSLEQTDTSPKSRHIPAAVRRAVRKRDGDRCRFVCDDGRRCTERRGLELHHHDPFGRGGNHDPDNVSLRCRRHNAYLAERDYGKDVFARYRGNGGRVSEMGPVYGSLSSSSNSSRRDFDWRPLRRHNPGSSLNNIQHGPASNAFQAMAGRILFTASDRWPHCRFTK
jgi:hypothetical protein